MRGVEASKETLKEEKTGKNGPFAPKSGGGEGWGCGRIKLGNSALCVRSRLGEFNLGR